MKVKLVGAIWVVAVLLAGCQALGIPQAETFSERLAAGYALNAQVRQTATDLLAMKKLSSADGQNVLEQTNNARAGLDIAKQLATTDTKSAEGKLTALRTALLAVQGYLALKKGD